MASEDTKILVRDDSKQNLIDRESPKQSYGSNEQSQSSSTTAPQQQQKAAASPPQAARPSTSAADDADSIERLSDVSEPRKSPAKEDGTATPTDSTAVPEEEEKKSPFKKLLCNLTLKPLVVFLIGLICFSLRMVVFSAKAAFYEVIVLGVTIMVCAVVTCVVPRGIFARDEPEYDFDKLPQRKKYKQMSPTLPDDFPMEPRPEVPSPEEHSTEQVHHAVVHQPDLPSSPSTSSAAKGPDPQGSEHPSSAEHEAPESTSSKTEAPEISVEENEPAIVKESSGEEEILC